jgi:hypothetical protein
MVKKLFVKMSGRRLLYKSLVCMLLIHTQSVFGKTMARKNIGKGVIIFKISGPIVHFGRHFY